MQDIRYPTTPVLTKPRYIALLTLHAWPLALGPSLIEGPYHIRVCLQGVGVTFASIAIIGFAFAAATRALGASAHYFRLTNVEAALRLFVCACGVLFGTFAIARETHVIGRALPSAAGFACGACIWITMLLIACDYGRFRAYVANESSLYCPRCGYARAGLQPDAACPECGNTSKRQVATRA